MDRKFLAGCGLIALALIGTSFVGLVEGAKNAGVESPRFFASLNPPSLSVHLSYHPIPDTTPHSYEFRTTLSS